MKLDSAATAAAASLSCNIQVQVQVGGAKPLQRQEQVPFLHHVLSAFIRIEADQWYLVSDGDSSVTLTHFKYKAVMTPGWVVAQLS